MVLLASALKVAEPEGWRGQGKHKVHQVSALEEIKALLSRVVALGRQWMFRPILAPGNIRMVAPALGKSCNAHAQCLSFLTIQSAAPNGFKVLSALKG